MCESIYMRVRYILDTSIYTKSTVCMFLRTHVYIYICVHIYNCIIVKNPRLML